jgi:hypothetical protein
MSIKEKFINWYRKIQWIKIYNQDTLQIKICNKILVKESHYEYFIRLCK